MNQLEWAPKYDKILERKKARVRSEESANIRVDHLRGRRFEEEKEKKEEEKRGRMKNGDCPG